MVLKRGHSNTLIIFCQDYFYRLNLTFMLNQKTLCHRTICAIIITKNHPLTKIKYMATPQGQGPERAKGWDTEVSGPGYGQRIEAARARYYERTGQIFKPRTGAQAGVNYADEALKTPDTYGLKKLSELASSPVTVVKESVPAGKTLWNYLSEYFRGVYGGRMPVQQEAKEIFATLRYMNAYNAEHYLAKNAQGQMEDKTRSINPDMLRQGDKIVITQGRISILHPTGKDAQGKTTYFHRLNGIPLRPGVGWTPQTNDAFITSDIANRQAAANRARNTHS